MKRLIYIGIVAVVLTACGTTSQAPLDDAYYWPDRTPQSAQIEQNTQSDQTDQTTQGSPQPTMEIISAQDTTITVRIKR